MKRFIFVLLICFLLPIAGFTQDFELCSLFPGNIPDTVCREDSTYFVFNVDTSDVSPELFFSGEGIVSIGGGILFNPSSIKQVGPVTLKMLGFCGKEKFTVEKVIEIVSCQSGCGTINFKETAPEGIILCKDSRWPYYFNPDYYYKGEGVEYSEGQVYFNPLSVYLKPGQYQKNVPITMGYQGCGEYTFLMTVQNCDTCRFEFVPPVFPNALCNTDSAFSLIPDSINNFVEVQGEGIVVYENEYYFDPSKIIIDNKARVQWIPLKFTEYNCRQDTTIYYAWVPVKHCSETSCMIPQIPQLPDYVCDSAGNLFISGVAKDPQHRLIVSGEGVYRDSLGNYLLDLSEIDFSKGQNYKNVSVNFYLVGCNSDTLSLYQSIIVWQCDRPCEPYNLPGIEKDTLCTADSLLLFETPIDGPIHYSVSGEGVIMNYPGYYLDGAEIDIPEGQQGKMVVLSFTYSGCPYDTISYKDSVYVTRCGKIECNPQVFPGNLPDEICADDTLLVVDSTISNYQIWGNGVEYIINGTYITPGPNAKPGDTLLIHFVGEKCGLSVSLHKKIVVKPCVITGLEEKESQISLVFPNPVVQGEVISIVDENFEMARLLDLSGIIRGEYTETQISTHNLDAGLYMLEIFKVNGEKEIRRILIE